MQFILIILPLWFLIGGTIFLMKKLPVFYKAHIIQAQIVDWTKRKNEAGFLKYTPMVEFTERRTNARKKISLERDSMLGFFIRRKSKIWIIISGQGYTQSLVSSVMDLLFPIALIIFGMVLIGQLLT